MSAVVAFDCRVIEVKAVGSHMTFIFGVVEAVQLGRRAPRWSITTAPTSGSDALRRIRNGVILPNIRRRHCPPSKFLLVPFRIARDRVPLLRSGADGHSMGVA